MNGILRRRSVGARPFPCARCGLALLALAAALSVGCGDGKIARYPVRGTVTVGGKPVDGARVFLCPVGGDQDFQKERPFGVTDASGVFHLTTFGPEDGAPAGDYQVMITNGRAGPDPREASADGAAAPQPNRGNPYVAPRYGNPDESGLKATVEKIETNELKFDLEPAPRRR